ncbi:MAG: hypothetical protein LBC39_01835 [Methanobrevibacter sp.]|nr:hypothetical protein [Candidatus Methanovirga aequatorialis]
MFATLTSSITNVYTKRVEKETEKSLSDRLFLLEYKLNGVDERLDKFMKNK